MNSLNQTLYFLRRDVDEWYEEGVSADYIHFEGELLWLDNELVWTASRAFDQGVARSTEASGSFESSLRTFELYRGRFAPEFEYDDWTMGWREHLHARYLHLGQTLVSHLATNNDLAQAERVAMAALRCDPEALDVERDLVWLYARRGSRAAAVEQYHHFAVAMRAQLGVEPATLREIIESPLGSPP